MERVESLSVTWAQARGWSDYLLSLEEDALHEADLKGIAPWFESDTHCPQSLRDLAARVASLTRLPSFNAAKMTSTVQGASARKNQQITAILQLLPQFFPKPTHLIDVGSGRGHLATLLAQAFMVPTLGMECHPGRVRYAKLRTGDAPVEFLSTDVLSSVCSPWEKMSPLRDRLIFTLHGCGGLADALVKAAADLKANVLVLSCCPQKIGTSTRLPLINPGLEIPRKVLGLANVLARSWGIEKPLQDELATKEHRLALRQLFEHRGMYIPIGEEMCGLNRRQPRSGFQALAEAAFRLRRISPPTQDELLSAVRSTHRLYQAIRRLSLPRSMLGRLLEIYLASDRARFLLTMGYTVEILEIFPIEVSPRNIALLARI